MWTNQSQLNLHSSYKYFIELQVLRYSIRTPKGPGMFLCLHFRSDTQTQRRMSCGLWPSLACAQQVVTNDLIVNLSWGGAFQWGTESLFVTTGSRDNVSRISTLKDAHAWMLASTHGYTHSHTHTHRLASTSGYGFRCRISRNEWHMKSDEWHINWGMSCVSLREAERHKVFQWSAPSGTVSHCWVLYKYLPS